MNGVLSQSVGQYKSWNPVYTGFSSDPTSNQFEYTLIGKMCTIQVATGNGTSNATTFTITLPYPAKTVKQARTMAIGTDNGTNQNSWVSTRSNSNILDVYRTATTLTWTASGNKGINFVLTYEIEG